MGRASPLQSILPQQVGQLSKIHRNAPRLILVLTWIKAPNMIPVFELGYHVDRIYYDSLDN
jgi:hypothetical protein